MRIRFRRYIRYEESALSPRKIKAAERALRREQEKHPLFSTEIEENQETPLERIERQKREWATRLQGLRDHQSRCWKEGRTIIRRWDRASRTAFLEQWNRRMYPAQGVYFLEYVRTYAQQNGLHCPKEVCNEIHDSK